MIFDLVSDFTDVLDAMPERHPRRRILKLLEEAVRRDVHFIDRCDGIRADARKSIRSE